MVRSPRSPHDLVIGRAYIGISPSWRVAAPGRCAAVGRPPIEVAEQLSRHRSRQHLLGSMRLGATCGVVGDTPNSREARFLGPLMVRSSAWQWDVPRRGRGRSTRCDSRLNRITATSIRPDSWVCPTTTTSLWSWLKRTTWTSRTTSPGNSTEGGAWQWAHRAADSEKPPRSLAAKGGFSTRRTQGVRSSSSEPFGVVVSTLPDRRLAGTRQSCVLQGCW